MKFGALIATDYQLFNILKFVFYDTEKSKKNIDLYISSSIQNVHKKAEKLRETGLFSNVYIIDKIIYSNNFILRKIKSSYLTFSKNSFLKFVNKKDREDILGKNYDIVIVPCATLLCEMFYNYFQHQKIYYIEDGLGSYFGNIHNTTMTSLHRYVIKILRREVKVDKIYVNQSKLCNVNFVNEIVNIPGSFTEVYKEMLKKIFLDKCYKQCYFDDDIIYLRQPLQDFGDRFLMIESDLIKCAKNIYLDRLIIREHPRNHYQFDNNCDIRIDNFNTMWECVSFEELTNNNVLIGMFSTAQITPKILFNKEPVIIFLFKIFPLPESKKREENDVVNLLLNIYQDKRKIFVPENINEYIHILKGLNSGE